MSKRLDIKGKRFNYLTVIRCAGGKGWLCRCDCGNEKVVNTTHLVRGRDKSCGCRMRELLKVAKTKHNESFSVEYGIWASIKSKCYARNYLQYKDYGAKGITMDKRWKDSYETFVKDMGHRPQKNFVFGRIDTTKGFTKENCVWESREKNLLKSKRAIVFRGKTLSQAARELGITKQSLSERLKKGWSIERAFTTQHL